MTTYQLLQEGFANGPKKPTAIGSAFQKTMASGEDASGAGLIPGQAWWLKLHNTLGGKPNTSHVLWGVNDGTHDRPAGTCSLLVYATEDGKNANDDIAGQNVVDPKHIKDWLESFTTELSGKAFKTPDQIEAAACDVVYELYYKYNHID